MKKILLTLAVTLGVLALAAPAAVADDERSGTRFQIVTARMTGAEEVPEAVDTPARGRSLFVIDHRRETVRFVSFARRIDGVTEAHVHLAPAGVNGPPVAFLFDADDIPLNVGDTEIGTRRGYAAAGVITAADLLGETTMAEFIDALTTGGAYVNVHTLDVRPGEIRGQIG